ncbi:hypothetical protein L7F22_025761 [Adiantum nelumboides]|nr:hypothetical protein [Adiantum nelumboides]
MKDLGEANHILGMRITCDRKKRLLYLSQKEYVYKVLDRFNMQKGKALSTPLHAYLKLSKNDCPKSVEEKAEMAKIPYASACGSLMYAMMAMRPDIAHAVGVVSKFMSNPGKKHWDAVKSILRYLSGTTDRQLCYGCEELSIKGYVDNDYAGCVDSREEGSVVAGKRSCLGLPWKRSCLGPDGKHMRREEPQVCMRWAVACVEGRQGVKVLEYDNEESILVDKIGQDTYSNLYKAQDLDNALEKYRFDNMEHDLAGLLACPEITFTKLRVNSYLHQLHLGLEHYHTRGILHRDIKGSNLLLDNLWILKIADFFLTTFFYPDQNQLLRTQVVTLWYRSLEFLLGAIEYGEGIDLWSTGCMLAELLAGKPIMPMRTEVEQLHKIFKLCGSPSKDYWNKSKLPHATIFKPQQPYKQPYSRIKFSIKLHQYVQFISN